QRSNYISLAWHRLAPNAPLIPYTTLFRSHGLYPTSDRQRRSGKESRTIAPDGRDRLLYHPGELKLEMGNFPWRFQDGRGGPESSDRKSTRLNSSHLVI